MPLRFEVDGTRAVMTGDLTRNAPDRIGKLLENHPNLELIELLDCPGSLDDQAALEASRMIRAAGINTLVPENGEIASGAVDFFIAGVERQVEDGGLVGVHSWSDGSREGADLPPEDSEHDLYEKYYSEMGISDQFYWFTLNAASSDDIHWMTQEELFQYGLSQ
jgi:hypothetical protein